MKKMPTRPPWASPCAGRLRAAVAKRLRLAARGIPSGAKRAMDVAAASMALTLFLPVFGLIAALIKLEDGGPVLFWQMRVGRLGRLFRFPKFRSMVVNAEEKLAAIQRLNQHGDGVTFKMRDDPRITRTGKILRRLSLDEAPQLWCVLTGEMTLVGPRPALPAEVARYTLEERRRLETTPGLTCIWQVSGRSNLPFPVQCRMDVDYIEQRNLLLDAKLLAATIPAVITGKGAY